MSGLIEYDISYIYSLMLHPKYSRSLRQIIPFVVIWGISGLVYTFLEVGLLGDLDYYPSTGNEYNFKNNLFFTFSATLLMGFIQGWIEVTWLRKYFEPYALWVKIFFKSLFYLLMIIFFLIALTVMNSMLNYNDGELGPKVVEDVTNFTTTFSFWSVVMFIGFALSIAIIISEISEHLGDGVLFNFLWGKYHKPKEETRIFMFLDMKGSTTIAEKIGHRAYFELIKACYADMTNAILETWGEVYQYVGDEIVVTWSEKRGLHKNNCIVCFDKICRMFEQKKGSYLSSFGVAPSFKAGFHIGEVTTGEIGIIKRDIIYTGDVLNTTARIQGECNNYNVKSLISENLFIKFHKEPNYQFHEIGELILRGKTESIKLFSVDFDRA